MAQPKGIERSGCGSEKSHDLCRASGRTFLFEIFTHVFIFDLFTYEYNFCLFAVLSFMIEYIKSKQSSLLSINVGSRQDQGLDSSTSSLSTSLWV